MIGLFLALLELVRERLVWAKQPRPLASIYLKALTEEPAERAVQKAILVVSAESRPGESGQTERQKQPSIPITELPPKSHPASGRAEYEKIEPGEETK